MGLVWGPGRDGEMKGKGRYKGRRGAGSEREDGQRVEEDGHREWEREGKKASFYEN